MSSADCFWESFENTIELCGGDSASDTHFFMPGVIPDIAYGYISENGTEIKNYHGTYSGRGHLSPARTKNGFTINALIFGYYNGAYVQPDVYIEIFDVPTLVRPSSITVILPTIGTVNLEYRGTQNGKSFYGQLMVGGAEGFPHEFFENNFYGFEIKIVEVGGGVVTEPDPNPNPNPNPIDTLFSYKFEVGQDIDPNGEFAFYGVSEASLTPIGAFIENIENDKIGKLLAVSWGYQQGQGHSLAGFAVNSDYLLTYSNNIELIVRDQNGEILSVTIPPENIFDISPPGENQPAFIFDAPLTEEQLDLLPKSGIVFVDIVLEESGDQGGTGEGADVLISEIDVGAYGALTSDFGPLTGDIVNPDIEGVGTILDIVWDDTASIYLFVLNPSLTLTKLDFDTIDLTFSSEGNELASISVSSQQYQIFPFTSQVADIFLPISGEQFSALPVTGNVNVSISFTGVTGNVVPDPVQPLLSKSSMEISAFSPDNTSFGAYLEDINHNNIKDFGYLLEIQWASFNGNTLFNLDIRLENTSQSLLSEDFVSVELKFTPEGSQSYTTLTIPSNKMAVMPEPYGMTRISAILTESEFLALPQSGSYIVEFILNT